MTDQPIGIGTRLWRHQRWASNRSNSFSPYVVVGENGASWICSPASLPSYGTVNVKKKTMTEAGVRGLTPDDFMTDDQRRDAMWLDQNRNAVSAAFNHCADASLLRQIATLLNIETKEPEL